MAEMQGYLIGDGEPAVPISDTVYYAEMWHGCERWPEPIAVLIAQRCYILSERFAFEEGYFVVKLIRHKAYTEIALYKPNDAGLEHLLTLCSKDIAGQSFILQSFIKEHGKIILI